MSLEKAKLVVPKKIKLNLKIRILNIGKCLIALPFHTSYYQSVHSSDIQLSTPNENKQPRGLSFASYSSVLSFLWFSGNS